jgi:hypothetical protein
MVLRVEKPEPRSAVPLRILGRVAGRPSSTIHARVP